METRTGHSVWAERYDREMEDVFEVQDEIARSIAQALRITLSPQEERSHRAQADRGLQAYDYFLRARSYARRENLEFALQMYEQAIRPIPASRWRTPASANVCGMVYEWHEQNQRWIERGLAACERALELDAAASRGAGRAGAHRLRAKGYDQAIQYALQAIERKADCEGAYNVLARAYFASDRIEEAAALVDSALEANGDDYNMYIPFMNALAGSGAPRRPRCGSG